MNAIGRAEVDTVVGQSQDTHTRGFDTGAGAWSTHSRAKSERIARAHVQVMETESSLAHDNGIARTVCDLSNAATRVQPANASGWTILWPDWRRGTNTTA